MKNTREFLQLANAMKTKDLARCVRHSVADAFNQPREIVLAAYIAERDQYRREMLADYLAIRAARKLADSAQLPLF